MAAVEKKRRWGKKKDEVSAEVSSSVGGDENTDRPSNVTGRSVVAATRAHKNAKFYAKALFSETHFVLTSQNKHDYAMQFSTQTTKMTPKFLWDVEQLEGNVLYWPECACASADGNWFEKLDAEFTPWKRSPYKRSRHPAVVEEKEMLASPTYCKVVEILMAKFPTFKLGYSIVNRYSDGDDWTDMHRDNYKAGGNRKEGVEAVAHNCTIGASFGAERELRFKHLETELEFSFPQRNGDVFAFTAEVNSHFQHAIPKVTPKRNAHPRISVILWGHIEQLPR